MKKIMSIILMITMVISLAACGGANPSSSSSTTDSAATESGNKPDGGTSSSSENPNDTTGIGNTTEPSNDGIKVLVAYYSATGTTKKVAAYAADAMDADIYEMVPAVPYTSDDLNYNNSGCRANTEMNDPSCRPEINGNVANMADYDIVFIGYPIWWGEAPRIVSTFVESYDFSGKTVVTFCTSGGSGHNDNSIKSLVSGANWITGARLNSNASKSDVAAWINGLGLTITAK